MGIYMGRDLATGAPVDTPPAILAKAAKAKAKAGQKKALAGGMAPSVAASLSR